MRLPLARTLATWTLATLLCSVTLVAAEECAPLSPGLSAHVAQYLAKRIKSQSGGVPSVVSVSRVPGTCYQKLTIQVSGTSSPMILYLSPDERFLTSTLYDLATDPEEEAARVAADVQRLLLRDESPQLKSPNPRVVLVEFGDLECPYCKRFAEWYSSLPAEVLSETTLVFKHLPLPVHPWAQLAAQYSACASRQSTEAFWQVAHYFLEHQDEITPASVGATADLVLSKMPNANAKEVASCATTEMGSGLVARDTAVAMELAVNRTPTLFVNGHRAPSVHSKDDLRLLLEHELQGHTANVPAAAK